MLEEISGYLSKDRPRALSSRGVVEGSGGGVIRGSTIQGTPLGVPPGKNKEPPRFSAR